MNKKTIITILLALVAVAGQGQIPTGFHFGLIWTDVCANRCWDRNQGDRFLNLS